jgi:hypothetical protein
MLRIEWFGRFCRLAVSVYGIRRFFCSGGAARVGMTTTAISNPAYPPAASAKSAVQLMACTQQFLKAHLFTI